MKTCPKCNRELPDTQAFCELCGTAVEAEPTPEQPQKPKRKKWLIPVVAAVAAVAVLVGVLIGGMLTCWYGIGGPAATLALAAKNTLLANNLSLDLEVEGLFLGQNIQAEGNARWKLNHKQEELTLIAGLQSAVNDGLEEGSAYKLMIADEKLYLLSYSGESVTAVETLDYDTDVLWDLLDDEIDWEERIEGTVLETYLDAERMDAFAKALAEKFTDRKWLKNTLGYKKTGRVHRFDFALSDLLEELLDLADQEELLKNKLVLNALENLDLPATNVVLEYTVEGGRLGEFRLQFGKPSEEAAFRLSMEFSKAGADKIKEKEIDEIRKQAKKQPDKQPDKQRVCPSCGEALTGDFCYYCADDGSGEEGGSELETSFGSCASCGTYTEMWWYGDKRLCVDCYYQASHGSGQTDENDAATEVPDRDAGFRDPDFPIYYN